MGFKVKLVSPDKIRRNQMAQDVSRGIGSFLGSTGDAMALSAQRQAAEQAGAQLNQQLGLNIPSSVYGQTNPGALLGMMANAQMAAKAQSARMEEANLEARARMEAEKLRMISQRQAKQPYYDYLTNKSALDQQKAQAELAAQAQTEAAIKNAGLTPGLPTALQAIELRHRLENGGGGSPGNPAWDWKQSGLTEGEMRQLNDRGYTPSILGMMTEAQRGDVAKQAFGRTPGNAPKQSDARENIATLRESAWNIDNMLYGTPDTNGVRNPADSIDSKINAAQRAGDQNAVQALTQQKQMLEARKAEMYDAAGAYEDMLMSGGFQDEGNDIDSILSELGIDDEE